MFPEDFRIVKKADFDRNFSGKMAERLHSLRLRQQDDFHDVLSLPIHQIESVDGLIECYPMRDQRIDVQPAG